MFHEFLARVTGHGVRVDEHFASVDEHTHGVFCPYLNSESSRRPVIKMYHPPSEQAPWTSVDGVLHGGNWIPASKMREHQAFFTLVHEFGHFLSWRADKASWDLVHAAKTRSTNLLLVWRPELMSADERKITYDEEERAWRLGRDHVPEELHVAYDAQAERNLSDYRRTLR